MSYLNLLSVPTTEHLTQHNPYKNCSVLLVHFSAGSYDILTTITPTLLMLYYILLVYLFILLSQGDNLLLTL